MTLDEYGAKISDIFGKLQQIAEATKNQAWAQCANTSNPAFISLLSRHAQLTKLAADLNNQILSQIENQAKK